MTQENKSEKEFQEMWDNRERAKRAISNLISFNKKKLKSIRAR